MISRTSPPSFTRHVIGETDPDEFIEMTRVNVLAPLRLVDRFPASVTIRGLIAVMSSSLGNRTYLAVNPGWVRTDIGGPDADLAIDESIPRIVDTLEGGLAFVDYNDQLLPW